MRTTTLRSAIKCSGAVAVALLCLLAPILSAGAQAPLSLSFDTPYFVVNTSNEQTRANYEPNIVVAPSSADVSCDPPLGTMFRRGATEVTCTATLGNQTRTGSFHVMVAKGDDTDVELGPITQDPSPVEPAGFVTYNVEYRTTVPTTARRVEISTTLPRQLRLDPNARQEPNCDTRSAPTITCVFFSVREADSFQLTVQAVPPFTGDIPLTWSLRLLPDPGTTTTQRDLFAGNNVATVTTEVRAAQVPNRVYIPLLRK